jgi:hypothetical protein
MMESTISRSACYETRSACYEENNKDKLRCTGDWRRTSVGAACRLPLPALHVDCRAAAVIFAPSDRTSTMTCGHTRKPLFDLTTDIYDATLIDVHAAASRTGSIRRVMRPARWRRRTRPSASCSTDTRQIQVRGGFREAARRWERCMQRRILERRGGVWTAARSWSTTAELGLRRRRTDRRSPLDGGGARSSDGA